MKLMVLNKFLISQHAPSIDEPHIIISIRTPGEHTILQEPTPDGASDEWIENNEKKTKVSDSCLGVFFADFYDLTKHEDHQQYGRIGPITDKQAMEIVKFVHELADKVNLIICQCEAGISRSAGLAAGLSIALNADDTHLYKSHYRPNVAVKSAIRRAYASYLIELDPDSKPSYFNEPSELPEPTGPVFHVWASSYTLNSIPMPPELVGQVQAESFIEACDRVAAQEGWGRDYVREVPAYWGRKLFNNEEDAT